MARVSVRYGAEMAPAIVAFRSAKVAIPFRYFRGAKGDIISATALQTPQVADGLRDLLHGIARLVAFDGEEAAIRLLQRGDQLRKVDGACAELRFDAAALRQIAHAVPSVNVDRKSTRLNSSH